MANVDAIVKSLEKDKYMFVMPQKYLDQLKENKFALLDEVKAINIGNDLPLTLSISLGTDYKSFIENFEAARSAMELALGRGGDPPTGPPTLAVRVRERKSPRELRRGLRLLRSRSFLRPRRRL